MIFSQIKREQVVTTIGELIEAKTEVANIVVDVLSGEIEMIELGSHLIVISSCGHGDESCRGEERRAWKALRNY